MNRFGYLYALSAFTGIISSSLHYTWTIALIVLFYVKRDSSKTAVTVCLCLFTLFYLYYQWIDGNNTTGISPGTSQFTGKVATIPDIDGDFLSFRLQTEQETLLVQHKIATFQDRDWLKENLHQGMVCQLNGEMSVPDGKRNFAGMDFALYLKRERIHWLVRADTLNELSCRSESGSVIDKISSFRENGIRYVEKNYPPDVSGLMNALVYGYREGIPININEAYQQMGLTHLLAVSGFNVAILMGLLFIACIRIGFTRENTAIAIACIIPLYILITGSEASIVRAGAMGMLILLLQRFKLKIHPLFAISSVFLFMLVCDPYYAFRLGFQLSFLNIFALLLSSRFILSRYTSYMAQIAASTVICQLVSFPLMIYHFFEISLWSVPLNLLFIPLISVIILPVTCVGLLFCLLSPNLGDIILYPAVHLLRLTNDLLLKLQNANFDLVFGQPPLFFFVLYYAGIFFLLIRWETFGLHRKLCAPLLILVCAGFFHWQYPLLEPRSKVTFLNVGQGDSILIELPHRKGNYLIDTGGSMSFEKEEWKKRKQEYNVTKEVVLPALKARGIRKITKLILTHGDMDHIGGAETVLTNVSVEEVMYPNGKLAGPLEKHVLNTAAELGIPISVAVRGKAWRVEDHVFNVISPYGDETESNARSVVLWAKISGRSFLFTGDLEEEGEGRIIKDQAAIKADVLKAGHHGSQTSSTAPFIDKAAPEYAIISAGKNNRYGHPHGEVLDRFKERGAAILRTDKLGDIEFLIKGGKTKIIGSPVNNTK